MAAVLSTTAFADRTSVVTGAASGIGAAVARLLGACGSAVAILDLDVAAAEQVAAALRTGGTDAIALHCDVTSPASVDGAVAAVLAWRGAVDHLVHCVGIVAGGALVAIEPETWRRSFAVNVESALLVARALHPALVRSANAAIVNIGSVGGTTAYPGGGGYGPSKAALIALSHQLAVEWAADGIRVNVINPGPTLTPLLRQVHSPESLADRARAAPLGRLVDPDDVASAVAFLLSDAAAAITAQALAVDCGASQALIRPARR